MSLRLIIHVITIFTLLGLALSATSAYYKRILRIPNKIFDGSSELFCTAQKIDADQFFVEFKMLVDKHDAIHHISIVMCEEPYTTEYIWDCMNQKICKPGTPHRKGVFTWGREANGWKLPEDIGVAVGNKSQYVILEVHSANTFEATDNTESGVEVTFTSNRPNFEAGIAILGSTGKIPPKVTDYTTDAACQWRFKETAFILSYSIHAHEHGKAISAYIVRDGRWIEIGRGNPIYPEVIMDIRHKRLEIRPGDVVASRCIYDNNEDRFVHFGHGARDEMCDVHLHYAYPTGSDVALKHVECAADAETFHWSDHYENIPANNNDPTTNTDQTFYILTKHWTKHFYRTMGKSEKHQ